MTTPNTPANGGQILTDLLQELLDEYLATMSSAYCQVDADEELVAKVRASLAAPAIPTVDSNEQDALTTMLWLYRRLPRAYGRSPLSERSIRWMAQRVGEEVEPFFAEREEEPSAQPAAQVAVPSDAWKMLSTHTGKEIAAIYVYEREEFVRLDDVVALLATQATVKTAEGL